MVASSFFRNGIQVLKIWYGKVEVWDGENNRTQTSPREMKIRVIMYILFQVTQNFTLDEQTRHLNFQTPHPTHNIEMYSNEPKKTCPKTTFS